MKVSKKGQIVIPAPYRDRLGIESGMEVQFRIRGHYLLVELNTEVTNDLRYLKQKKGGLGAEDLDDTNLQEIIYDLLAQQFYHGKNILTDRIGRKQYEIRGSDSIVQQVIDMMVHSGRHWLEENFADTLKEFADNLEIDFPSLLSKFVTKLRSMEVGGDDMIKMMGGEVIFSMAVGEALMQFRTRIGDETRERLLKEADVLGYVDKLGDETIEDIVIGHLADKYSILLNLRVLRELARMSVKSVGDRDFMAISKELLSEFKELETPAHIIRRRERRRKRAAKNKGKISPKVKEGEAISSVVEDEIRKPVLPDVDDMKDDSDFDLPEMPDFD